MDPCEGAPFFAPEEYRGEHLLIRSYRAGDGVELNAATLESYEHLRPWMPWATETQSEEEAERLVRTFRARYLLSQDFTLAIRTADGGRLLGGCGYHLREGPLRGGNAELGMWIRAGEAGRGIGTEALVSLLEWGFSAWPWRRLSWRCDARNAASRRIAEKAGMLREGVLRSHQVAPGGERRDTVCCAALRGEWRRPLP